MTKKLSPKRYCAIADGLCDEIEVIDFAGFRSCFFAYPFTSYYIDFAAHLQKELARSLNIRTMLPTDVVATIVRSLSFTTPCKESYQVTSVAFLS